MGVAGDRKPDIMPLHGMETEQFGVSEELSSTHEGTGVEREPQADINEPFEPERIDVITRNPTVELLLSRIRDNMIDLAPDFQRAAGIWTIDYQSKLIESLLLRIPLPTFYAAENRDGVWVIVDGIQRLTTIARFVEPASVGLPPLLLRGDLGKSGQTIGRRTGNSVRQKR